MGIYYRFAVLVFFCLASVGHAQQFGGPIQHFAQIAVGGGATTVFNLHAPGPSSVTVEIQLYGSDGAQMQTRTVEVPANGSAAVSFGGNEGAVAVGWARLVSTAPFAATEFFQIQLGTTVLPRVGVLPCSPSATIRFFGFAKKGETQTGMALANPSDSSAATLTVRRYNASGAPGGTATLTLGPRGHLARFLNEEPLFPGLDDFEGVLEVETDKPIIALMLRSDQSVLTSAAVLTPFLGSLTAGSVTTEYLADGAVTTEKLAPGAVTRDSIAPGQVVTSVNGLTDAVELIPGANLTITQAGQTLTLAATGGPGGAGEVSHDTTLTGSGTTASPLSIADSGVTPAKLSASGSTAGQVLASNGSAVTWQSSGPFTLPYTGSASADTPNAALSLTSSGTGYAVFGYNSAASNSGALGGAYGVYGLGSSARGVMGESTSAAGVFGLSSSGSGVIGSSTSGWGVSGMSASNDGVTGVTDAADKSGVWGRSTDGFGITGMSTNNAGVKAITSSVSAPALLARNLGSGRGVTGESASAAGVYGESSSGIGVVGRSSTNAGVSGTSATGDGVSGTAEAADKSGVWGSSTSGFGVTGTSDQKPGVRAITHSSNTETPALLANNLGAGPAILAYAGSGGYAALLTGRTRTEVLEITGGSDFSEQFNVSDAGGVHPAPGMVVSIDPTKEGRLVLADRPYDRSVAGVVSGAGGIRPGVLMGQAGSPAFGNVPVSLSGRVYCWADASFGAISPGDLLTTSTTPGHVMRVGQYEKARGAIIGKAMSTLPSGRGLILALVTLQ